jgi:hypothetical protein
MCSGKNNVNPMMCPHLRGSNSGAICDVVKDYVRDITNVEIKFCMSKYFEICHVYRYAIKRANICRNQLSF